MGDFRMKLKLISLDQQRPDIVLSQFPVIVGLDPGADICLDDSAVGHYQCMIDYGDGSLMVWDLGTRAGTLINGVRISANAPLLPGDEIAFGKHRFNVEYDGVKATTSTKQNADSSPQPTSSPRRRREPALQD
jgi:pSer/pThr/pTyr-binding forkhead associated (FHA) protein